MADYLKRTTPLTKVQKQVLARIERGERLIFLPTNRASGDAIFWVVLTNEGWQIKEKALYPQLRKLFWYGEIGDDKILPKDTPITGSAWELHYAGVIGY